MPIYEYRCNACGHRFDVLQRVGQDGSQLECPKCGQTKPEKMLSSFASSMSGESYSSHSGGRCSSGFG